MNEIVFETIFSDENISKLPISQQSDFARKFQEILEKLSEDNPNATIRELLNNI